jgi:hypothetical protein
MEPGLTAETRRIFDDRNATVADIDRAQALDICACSDQACVASLMLPYHQRRSKAVPGRASREDAVAVRRMRRECMIRNSHGAYLPPPAPQQPP